MSAEEEAKLRAAIDAAQDAFVVIDEQSRVQLLAVGFPGGWRRSMREPPSSGH